MYYMLVFLLAFQTLVCFDPGLLSNPKFNPKDEEPLTLQSYNDLLAERGLDLVLARVITHDKMGLYEHFIDAERLSFYLIREINTFCAQNPSIEKFKKWIADKEKGTEIFKHCINHINKLPIQTVQTYAHRDTGAFQQPYGRPGILLFIVNHAPRYDLTREECEGLGMFFLTFAKEESPLQVKLLEQERYYFKRVLDTPGVSDEDRVRLYKHLADCAWLLQDKAAIKKYLKLYVQHSDDRASKYAIAACTNLALLYAESDEPEDRAHACAYAHRVIACASAEVARKNAMRLLIARLSAKPVALRYAHDVLGSSERKESEHKRQARAIVERLK